MDDPLLILEAVRAGIGIGYLGELHVSADLASGRLVPLLQEWSPSYPGICLYYPSRRHVPAGLRAFIDLVREVAPIVNDGSGGRKPPVPPSRRRPPRSRSA